KNVLNKESKKKKKKKKRKREGDEERQVEQEDINGYHRSTTETHLVRAIVFADDRGGDGDHSPPFQGYALRSHQGDNAISRRKMGSAAAGTLSRCPRFGEGRDRAYPLRCLSALRIHLSAAGDQNRAERNSGERPLQQGREISARVRYRYDSLHFLRDV